MAIKLVGFAPKPEQPYWGICDCLAVVEADFSDTENNLTYNEVGVKHAGLRWVHCPRPKCKGRVPMKPGKAPSNLRLPTAPAKKSAATAAPQPTET